MDRSKRTEKVALVIAIAWAVLTIVLRVVSNGIVEMGDGVQHYMQARYCWAHPELLLDLWGKPLFMLLASPFAQLGYPGMVVFNAILAVCTCRLAVDILRRAGSTAQLLFPVLVLLAPLYLLMVLGGMTEILFGTLTVLTVALLGTRRYTMAAVVASLTPFSRPEYVAFLPFVALWLAMVRQWRALPWCVTGWVIYGAIMGLVAGDPFWFWTHGPYRSGPSVYGSGDLLQFILESPRIFGWPLLFLFLVALGIWYPVQRQDTEEHPTHRLLFVVAALPVLSVLALHSYIWWRGIHASAGLVRVAVTIVPLAALFALHTVARAAVVRPVMLPGGLARRRVLLGVPLVLGGIGAWDAVRVPIQQSGDQQALDGAGDRLKRILPTGGVVHSTHPYAAFRAGLDPFDEDHYRTIWGLNDQLPADHFKPGELIFWDSQLGPNEAHLPLDTLLNDPHFAVRGVWEPREGHSVLGDQRYELFLFERRDVVREARVDTLIDGGQVAEGLVLRADTTSCPPVHHPLWCFGEDAFPLVVERMLLTPGAPVIYDELVLEGKVERSDPSDLQLVFKQTVDGHHVRYDQLEVTGDRMKAIWHVPPADPGVEQSIYLWNVGGTSFGLSDLRLIRRRWIQRDAT